MLVTGSSPVFESSISSTTVIYLSGFLEPVSALPTVFIWLFFMKNTIPAPTRTTKTKAPTETPIIRGTLSYVVVAEKAGPEPPPPLLPLPESITTEEDVMVRPPIVVLLLARAVCRLVDAVSAGIETGLATAETTTDPATILEMVTHSKLVVFSPNI